MGVSWLPVSMGKLAGSCASCCRDSPFPGRSASLAPATRQRPAWPASVPSLAEHSAGCGPRHDHAGDSPGRRVAARMRHGGGRGGVPVPPLPRALGWPAGSRPRCAEPCRAVIPSSCAGPRRLTGLRDPLPAKSSRCQPRVSRENAKQPAEPANPSSPAFLLLLCCGEPPTLPPEP